MSLPIERSFEDALQRSGKLGGSRSQEECFRAFLESDFHATAKGSLPLNVKVSIQLYRALENQLYWFRQ